jgi:hypothetical protein
MRLDDDMSCEVKLENDSEFLLWSHFRCASF